MNEQQKPKVEIKAGQIWRDKDKRREQNGNVRTFTVHSGPDKYGWVACDQHCEPERLFSFRVERFGSGRANDSFELVEDINA